MVFAKNDIGFVFGNTRFLKCKVSLRKNAIWPNNYKDVRLSELANTSFTHCKGQIVCFCDGIKETKVPGDNLIIGDINLEPIISVQEEFSVIIEDEHEPVELDHEFDGKNVLTISDIKESRDNKYHAEKIVWVHHNSDNIRLVNGIDHGYDCDEQYCLERLTKELEGFFIVDHTTIFWKSSYPSEIALTLEDDLKLKLNGSRSKYGTQIKICLLEEHNHVKYDDVEAIVMVNYLGKFDVIGIIDKVAPRIYEQQRQSECFGSEVFSD
jgi:hypothetical protein